MARRKLYLVVLVGSIAGYFWLGWNLYVNTFYETDHSSHISACFFKSVTGIPCPSCGITRSILALMKGNISEAVYLNPLGLFMAAMLLILPLWVGVDYLKNSNSFCRFYKNAELQLRRKIIAIPAIVLVIANWIWNIYKHL